VNPRELSCAPARDKAVEGLRHYLESHGLEPGDRLPAERELCEKIGVSRTALRGGIAQLRSRHVLESRPGSGTYVARMRPINVMGRTFDFSEAVRQAGREPSSRVVCAQVVLADEALGERLEVREGTSLFHLRRVRLADAEPLIIDDSYVNRTLCPGVEDHDFSRLALYEVLLSEYAIRVVYSMERVTVGRLTPEEAHLLEAREGQAALVLDGTERSTADDVVEYLHSVTLPGRYRIASVTSL
jgi:GntR family transcriptional regulator